jgi:hypothetical protein
LAGFGRPVVVSPDAFESDLAMDGCDVLEPGGLARGLDRGRRLRLVATARAAYGWIELKSKVDGIGSGSCFSVPYVTTITRWSSSEMSLGSPVCCSPST